MPPMPPMPPMSPMPPKLPMSSPSSCSSSSFHLSPSHLSQLFLPDVFNSLSHHSSSFFIKRICTWHPVFVHLHSSTFRPPKSCTSSLYSCSPLLPSNFKLPSSVYSTV